MKTEKTIRRIMRRFECSRQEALTAPDKILDLLPETPVSLTEEEIAYGELVIARLDAEFAARAKS